MSQINRKDGGLINKDKTITFTFNGHILRGFEGDPLRFGGGAVALIRVNCAHKKTGSVARAGFIFTDLRRSHQKRCNHKANNG